MVAAYEPIDPRVRLAIAQWPDDAPRGSGPGLAGTAPKRPRGKRGSAEADQIGDAVEQDQAGMKARRHQIRDEVSETGVKKPKDTTRRH